MTHTHTDSPSNQTPYTVTAQVMTRGDREATPTDKGDTPKIETEQRQAHTRWKRRITNIDTDSNNIHVPPVLI